MLNINGRKHKINTNLAKERKRATLGDDDDSESR